MAPPPTQSYNERSVSDDRNTPESPIPLSYDDDITGNYVLSPEIKALARRVRKVEKHFEKGGMVAELHGDWSAIKKFFGVFRWAGPMLASLVIAAIVGVIWLVNHAATQPTPPSAEQIAREIVKQQKETRP
jgi:hypothetical protein